MSKKKLRPIDIRYPERTPLPGGAIFATLPTLTTLEAFWAEHRQWFPFAASGVSMVGGQDFLDSYEWVFAPTIPALVKTVTRWDEVGTQVEWYDWATVDPDDHASFFADREYDRRHQLEKGAWSDADQKQFEHENITKTQETYRGWWMLTNLPNGCEFYDWFNDFPDEINDPSLSREKVAEMFQIQTFENWRTSCCTEVEFHDANSLDEYIAYWRAEHGKGYDYYGQENEKTDTAS